MARLKHTIKPMPLSALLLLFFVHLIQIYKLVLVQCRQWSSCNDRRHKLNWQFQLELNLCNLWKSCWYSLILDYGRKCRGGWRFNFTFHSIFLLLQENKISSLQGKRKWCYFCHANIVYNYKKIFDFKKNKFSIYVDIKKLFDFEKNKFSIYVDREITLLQRIVLNINLSF